MWRRGKEKQDRSKQASLNVKYFGSSDSFEHPPTLDELCRMLGLASRGSLHKHIQALVKAGLVEPLDGDHRGIRLVPEESGDRGVPFFGKIAAGHPIEALPQPEYMEIPPQLRTERPCYVLQVEGDSMIDVGILDGDYVVIEHRNHARNGEVVVALIHREEATLKRIVQESGKVVLYSENSEMDPIEVRPEEIEIQGVLVGQMRSYR